MHSQLRPWSVAPCFDTIRHHTYRRGSRVKRQPTGATTQEISDDAKSFCGAGNQVRPQANLKHHCSGARRISEWTVA